MSNEIEINQISSSQKEFKSLLEKTLKIEGLKKMRSSKQQFQK